MKRVAGLDTLRALAVCWVMLFHSFLVGGLGPNFEWLSRFGWAGVDMFFVLSGFLIGLQVLRPLQHGGTLALGAFYARRAWRILPAFFVVLAVYASVPAWREAPGMQPWWQFATFTMNLLIDYDGHQAFSHAWSLCVEEQFYLFFPLLALWWTRRPSVRGVGILWAAVLLLGIVLRGAVWCLDSAAEPSRNWFIEDIYYPSWMRLDGLFAGVMLAALRTYRPVLWERWQAHSNAIFVCGLLASGLAFWLFRDRTGLLANSLGWPVLSAAFGLLVFSAADGQRGIGRLKLPGSGWIAAISYSLYLSHKIVFHWVQSALLQWPVVASHRAISFAAYAIGALLIGSVLHVVVERPFLVWRDRRSLGGALRVPMNVSR